MSLRLGTRASKLALAQANLVAEKLRATHPGLDVELVEMTTAGDRDKSSRLTNGQGWFTTTIQDALRAGEVDFAVHSYKDLPTSRPEGLVLASVPFREDPRDVLVSRERKRLRELPQGAVIGTSSPRREAQLRAIRPDVEIRLIRGNVDSRIAKVEAGEYDATILALAGLRRLGLEERADEVFGIYELLPAPAQGALALECRVDDAETRALLAAIDDLAARQAVTAERAFLAEIDGGCSFPASAFAELFGSTIKVHGLLAADSKVVRAKTTGSVDTPAGLGRQLARDLMAQAGIEK